MNAEIKVTLHINVTGALHKNYNYKTLSVSAATETF